MGRVRRGNSWSHGDEDGGEGNVGTIVCTKKSSVTVKWDRNPRETYEYDADDVENQILSYEAGPSPPPQGWLPVTQRGIGSPPAVLAVKSSLCCACCKQELQLPKIPHVGYSLANGQNIKK